MEHVKNCISQDNKMDIEKALHFLRTNAQAYAEAKANRIYLSEFRKSKKALLMISAEQQGKRTSQERESYAYGHQEYVQLLEGLKVAIEVEEKLSLDIERAKLMVEVWRTNESTKRAEMAGYGNRS